MNLALILQLTIMLSGLISNFSWGAGASVAELDAILTEAHSIEEFLADTTAAQQLRDRYWEVARQYYKLQSNPLGYKSFNAINLQVKKVIEQIPEVGERLWQVDTDSKQAKPFALNDFNLKVKVQNSGLELKVISWLRAVTDWEHQLQSSASQLQAIEFNLAKYFLSLDQQLKDFYQQNANTHLDRKARIKHVAQHHQAIISSNDFKMAAQALLLQVLQSEQEIHEKLFSEVAEYVIDALDGFKNSEVYRKLGLPLSRSLITLVLRAALLPVDLPSLTLENGQPNQNEYFQVATVLNANQQPVVKGRLNESQFYFRTIHRKFHLLYRGLAHKDCFAGGGSLDRLTPERYLTAILTGAQVQYVEGEQGFAGYVAYQPLVVGEANGSRVYWVVDLLSRVLQYNELSNGDSAFSKQSTNLVFQQWLSEVSQRLPPAVAGIALSDSNQVRNEQVMVKVVQTPQYIFARKIGLAGAGALHYDQSLAKKIVSYAKTLPLAKLGVPGPGNMISEGTIEGARWLYAVEPMGLNQLLTDFNNRFQFAPLEHKLTMIQYLVHHQLTHKVNLDIVWQSLAQAKNFDIFGVKIIFELLKAGHQHPSMQFYLKSYLAKEIRCALDEALKHEIDQALMQFSQGNMCQKILDPSAS